MAEFEESLEELQEKLEQYKVQLNVVETALQEHEQQDSLLQLQSDLNEVINLTQDLISYKSSIESSDLDFLNAPSLLNQSYDQASDLTTPSAATANQESQRIQTLIENGSKSTQLTQLIGRTCQAQYQGRPYYAEILKIQEDPKLGTCALVQYIGYGNKQVCPLAQIQLLVPPSLSLCKPGANIQALFSEDGKWYNCLIDEQTPRGFQVTFTDYGNSEEVPFDRIRFSKSQAKEATKSRIKEIVTPGGYRIPEYLTSKPNDSDTQKLNKKKRIQSIKKKQKTEQIHEDAQNRAVLWRKFNTKASNKKLSGFLSGRGHQSIFKSSDQQNLSNPNLTPSTSKYQPFVPRRKHDAQEISET